VGCRLHTHTQNKLGKVKLEYEGGRRGGGVQRKKSRVKNIEVVQKVG